MTLAEGSNQGNAVLEDLARAERILELEAHLRNVLEVMGRIGGWMPSTDQATLRAAREALL